MIHIFIFLYNCFTTLIIPYYILMLLFRLIIRKENLRSVIERFALGDFTVDQNKYNLWIHAASVGETRVALTVIKSISEIHKDIRFILTTNTISSYKIIEQCKDLTNIYHKFIPYDNYFIIKRFLNKTKPDLAIFIESEIWPYILYKTSKHCKILLLNAIISDRSFEKWSRVPYFIKPLMARYAQVITQTKRNADKFRDLGAIDPINLGNIKYCNPVLDFDHQKYEELSNILKDKIVFTYGSIHYEDELKILKNVFYVGMSSKEIQEKYYHIIVPRHPREIDETIYFCNKFKLSYSVRSKQPVPTGKEHVYIVDELGSLGLFYKLSHISFIGGSFKHGGHNPIEPLQFGNMVLYGMDMTNFEDIAHELYRASLTKWMGSGRELCELMLYIGRKTPEEREDMFNKLRIKSQAFLSKKQHILKEYTDIIDRYIKENKT